MVMCQVVHCSQWFLIGALSIHICLPQVWWGFVAHYVLIDGRELRVNQELVCRVYGPTLSFQSTLLYNLEGRVGWTLQKSNK